jgi:hypothetical protein
MKKHGKLAVLEEEKHRKAVKHDDCRKRKTVQKKECMDDKNKRKEINKFLQTNTSRLFQSAHWYPASESHPITLQ